MTVKELKDMLAEYSDDMKVIKASIRIEVNPNTINIIKKKRQTNPWKTEFTLLRS